MVKVENNLTVTVDEGKTVEATAEGIVVFDLQKNKSLTIKGPENVTSENKPILKSNAAEGTTAAVIQNRGGNLVISDVNIEGETGIHYCAGGGSTKLENVDITSHKGFGLSSNQKEVTDSGSEPVGDIILTNCNIKSEKSTGMYLPAQGKVTISGGSVSGWTAIYTKGCDLELKDEVKLTGWGYRFRDALSVHNNGQYECSMDGSVLVIVSQNGYAQNKTVKINIDESVIFEKISTEASHENEKGYLIEIVGTKTAISNEVAGNLEITCEGRFGVDETDTSFQSDVNQISKLYLIDIDGACKTSIKVNSVEKNSI